MPRGKKRTEATPVSETNAVQLETPITTADAAKPIAAESEPPQASSDSHSGTAPSRGQFRSWVVDARRGYSGLTDEVHHRLVLQFAEKPHPDVLTAVKDAGFQFKPDHYGLKNVWVRKNDFEGRLQVESIEKLLRSVSDVLESHSL